MFKNASGASDSLERLIGDSVVKAISGSPALLALVVYARLSGELLVGVICHIGKSRIGKNEWVRGHLFKIACGMVWISPFLYFLSAFVERSLIVSSIGLFKMMLTSIFLATIALIPVFFYWVRKVLP